MNIPDSSSAITSPSITQVYKYAFDIPSSLVILTLSSTSPFAHLSNEVPSSSSGVKPCDTVIVVSAKHPVSTL